MKDLKTEETCKTTRETCECLPRPVRMNYFHGQLISERDLRTEQLYFREKLRHANRCLHGYGVLCGLLVHPGEPPEDCLPDDSKQRKEIRRELAKLEEKIAALKAELEQAETDEEKTALVDKLDAAQERQEQLRQNLDGLNDARPDTDHDDCEEPPQPVHLVRVSCGAAIDCDGNDIILAHDQPVNILALLTPSEREKLSDGHPHTVYLSVCYQECGLEPTRPFALDSCATTTACQYSRVAEGGRLTASLSAPVEDLRCEPCCDCCDDPCILLAAIEVMRDEPIEKADIDHSVRRRFGLYEATVITGISWTHGATYDSDTANEILGTRDENGGIEITFSRPVHVSTLTHGVIELLRITGGRGLSGVIAAMEGEYVGLPADGMVDRVRYRDTTGETVQPKDRIMIVVRGPFILDGCCRPIDGLHIGGRVPRIDGDGDGKKAALAEQDANGAATQVCTYPPYGPVPWASSGSGNFESWFSVAEE